MVLGWGSRSRHLAADAAAGLSSASASAPASPADTPSLSLLGSLTPGPATAAPTQSQARTLLAGLPLMFEPNQGQANLDPADPRIKFVARGSGYSLMLGSEGAILNLTSRNPKSNPAPKDSSASDATASSTLRVESLRMKLAGASLNPSLTATDRLPSTSNYLLGNDPSKWQHNVPQFARVRYENIYPGINLAFYGNQGRLEYDFQVAPGSDPAQAQLEFDGAKRLQLQDGALLIEAQGGAVRLDAPRVYQQIDGRQQPVAGSFVLQANNRVGFAIGPYDHSRELVIDPVLSYSTYFGGTGDEHASQVAVDSLGNIYLAGSTTSANLPVQAGNFQGTLKGTQNVYIAKINPSNGVNGLIFVTYLGGDGIDTPAGVAVDGAGDPFVAGTTTSDNFPTSLTPYQSAPEAGSTGTQHVFVTELLNNADGVANSLYYSSYLSGSGDDIATGMAIDAKGYIYVTGTTTSVETLSSDQFPATNLPQALPFQNLSRSSGNAQFFVTKVNTNAPRAGSIAYSTYFGGGNFSTPTPIAVGGGIAVDTNGNIYFSGTTNFIYTGCQGCSTTDFPILNAYQPCLNQTPPVTVGTSPSCPNDTTSLSDAFVAKLNPNAAQGNQLQWSTYLGGSQSDSSTGVAVDSGAAFVYVVGTTNSPDVTVLSTFGSYQTCLDSPGVAAGTVCPVITAPGPTDAFVARFSNVVSSTTNTNLTLTYFSYLGGSGNDSGSAITVDSADGALITGSTQSTNFPVFPNPNSIQSQLNGTQDAFVARLNTAAVVGQTTTASWANYFGGSGVDEGTGITLDANQTVYVVGDTNSTDLQVSKPYEGYQGGYDAFVTQLGTASSLSITGVLSLGTNQTYISAGNQATFTYTLTNNGPDLANNITINDNIDPANTGVALTYVSAAATSGTCGGGSTSTNVTCSIQSLQSGSTATITIVLVPTASSSGGSATFNGGTVTVSGANNTVYAQTSVSGKMSDFSILAGPSSVVLAAAGDTATYQVLLTPNPVYGSSIALTCSGLPTGATCAFTTTPVTLVGSSPGSSTLNISTTARPVILPTTSLLSRHFYAMWLWVPGLALVGIGAGSDRRRRRMLGLFLLSLVFAMLLLQPACSSTPTQPPVSGTPAGVYSITVAGTSGSDAKNATVSMTVP